MAEEYNTHHNTAAAKTEEETKTTDRGLFDFVKNKKDDQGQDEEKVMAAEFDNKVKVSEESEEKEKKHDQGILEKLHRSGSSSSSSSSDEEEEDEEKRKKNKEKKSLKDKIKDQLPTTITGNDEQKKIHMEKDEVKYSDHQDNKEGLLDKIKEKLPGHDNDEGDYKTTPPPPSIQVAHGGEAVEDTTTTTTTKEKKGLLDKIREKIPGFHSKTTDDDKGKVSKDEAEIKDKDYSSA